MFIISELCKYINPKEKVKTDKTGTVLEGVVNAFSGTIVDPNQTIYEPYLIYDLLNSELTSTFTRHKVSRTFRKFISNKKHEELRNKLIKSFDEEILQALLSKDNPKKREFSKDPIVTGAIGLGVAAATLATGGLAAVAMGGAVATAMLHQSAIARQEQYEEVTAITNLHGTFRTNLRTLFKKEMNENFTERITFSRVEGTNSMDEENIQLYNKYIELSSRTEYTDTQGNTATYKPGQGDSIVTFMQKRLEEKDKMDQVVLAASGLTELKSMGMKLLQGTIAANIQAYSDGKRNLVDLEKKNSGIKPTR
jgi:hypothetical protein